MLAQQRWQRSYGVFVIKRSELTVPISARVRATWIR